VFFLRDGAISQISLAGGRCFFVRMAEAVIIARLAVLKPCSEAGRSSALSGL
jgi:hypothetical protein